jgi:hypothetical protein
MSFSLIATAVVSLALSQAATSAPTAGQEQVSQAPQTSQARHASETLAATDPNDKIICRKVRSVGSNLATRDCRTVGQRRKEAEEAKDALRNGQSVQNLDLGAR